MKIVEVALLLFMFKFSLSFRLLSHKGGNIRFAGSLKSGKVNAASASTQNINTQIPAVKAGMGHIAGKIVSENNGGVQSSTSSPHEYNDLIDISPNSLYLSVKKWIIFSDLHVRGSSIDCCEDVLNGVHLEARNRHAGIIFLGDFWHVRGAVSVELLNRVLQCLKRWEVPVILIPGKLSYHRLDSY